MAIVTNTVTTYLPKNIREDLSDVIYNISPTDVPFMSNAGRGKAKNTYFEWQVDELAATGANAQLDGDDVSTTTDARAATTRVGNYTQISRKLVSVSGSTEAVDKAGMKGMMAYELAKASSELKRDMEAILVGDQIAAAGSTTVARKTAAIGGWLITNASVGAGAGAVPVMSSGGSLLSGYPATIAVAGTARAFTSTLLKTTAQNVWAQGGDLKMVMVGPTQKVVFSGFTGIATLYRETPAGKQAQIIGAADVFLTDFGELTVVPNRFQANTSAIFVNPELVAVNYLRNFQTIALAKTGDAEKRMLIVEYGLQVRAQKGLGIIRDLT